LLHTWPLTFKCCEALSRNLTLTSTYSVLSPSRQQLPATMLDWLVRAFGGPPKPPKPKPPPPTHIQSRPTPDSSILGRFFDLNISIKQHVESFPTSDRPGQRREIGMKIFSFLDSDSDEKSLKQLEKSLEQYLLDRRSDICKIGKSLRALLLEQPDEIWKWGLWDNPPEGYIVVFPSIWKGEVMVRNWEIVESR